MVNTQSPKNFYLIMNAKEYGKALEHFGLEPRDFAEMIGVSWRQGERYRDGSSGIPDSVAKLIRTLIKHNLGPDDVG